MKFLQILLVAILLNSSLYSEYRGFKSYINYKYYEQRVTESKKEKLYQDITFITLTGVYFCKIVKDKGVLFKNAEFVIPVITVAIDLGAWYYLFKPSKEDVQRQEEDREYIKKLKERRDNGIVLDEISRKELEFAEDPEGF